MINFRHLVIVLAAIMPAYATSAQVVSDPDFLARYDALEMAGTGSDGVRDQFEKFASDYIAAAQTAGHVCLFGCAAGFSGSGPNRTGAGHREFLAQMDLTLLARKLELPSEAIDHLTEAERLLQARLTSQQSLSDGSELKEITSFANDWLSFEGCIATTQPVSGLAWLLLIDVEHLEKQSLTPNERLRLRQLRQRLEALSKES
jgi:hypothetical protein